MDIRTKSYIAGEWVAARSGATFAVENPASGKVIAQVSSCAEEETHRAIQAAFDAFQLWRILTATERADKLKQLARAFRDNITALANLITSEQGKPLKEAHKEIEYGASYLEWFAEEAKRIYGDTIPGPSKNRCIIVQKEPIGVCAAITPWNFPNAMLTRKLAAALAAGCTIICKPAPETPLSALAIAALCEEVGIPKGVVNIICGDAETIAKILMQSQLVRKITFTGSTEVGKILYKQSSDTIKKITLELGGNAPFIVFEDADLEKAVTDALYAKYRNTGQTCICANRFLIQQSILSEFTSRLTNRVKMLKVGNGLDDVDIGPLISEQARIKICGLMQDAIDKGAKLSHGKLPDGPNLFMQPSIINNVDASMRIYQEEIFGPVAAITSFHSEDEAIEKANSTNYGLASYFYTKDLNRAMRVAQKLEFGMVGVNDTAISAVQAPFGGIKQSGFGREGSKYGLDDYLNIKYLSIAY